MLLVFSVPGFSSTNFQCEGVTETAIQCTWDEMLQVYWQGIPLGKHVPAAGSGCCIHIVFLRLSKDVCCRESLFCFGGVYVPPKQYRSYNAEDALARQRTKTA